MKIQPISNDRRDLQSGVGGSEPPLRELNETLAPFESTIQVNQSADDGLRFCREAVSRKVDLILVYGGDGTVSQVLDGLDGSEIPVLIMRGGTGNLIADELDLPVGIPETLALFTAGEIWARPIDLGMINRTTCFVLHCGCGLEVKALLETVSEGVDTGSGALTEQSFGFRLSVRLSRMLAPIQ